MILYYARAIDSTMCVALGSLAATRTTEETAQAITQPLNYCSTHPNASVRYHSSDMILWIHSENASYLSEPKAYSRAGCHYFLSDQPSTIPSHNSTPPGNGAIYNLSTIMEVALSSTTKAETGTAFFNAKDGVPLRLCLAKMGHPPQPSTPLQVDNNCAAGIINRTIKQCRSKAMDMHFYWLQDQVDHQQFHIYWRKGSDNLADYFTKHHPPLHHHCMRSKYVLELHKKYVVSGEGVLIGERPDASGFPFPETTLDPSHPPNALSLARSTS
jgi:hypothetical protein